MGNLPVSGWTCTPLCNKKKVAKCQLSRVAFTVTAGGVHCVIISKVVI